MQNRVVDLSLKLESSAVILLMVATCFAVTPAQLNNATVLNAYTRHLVQATQDMVRITDKAARVNEKEILSDHFIRVGRHLQLLNLNLDALEKTILGDEQGFITRDQSKEIDALQAKLVAMGFRGKMQHSTEASRRATLAKIKKYGLKNYIRLTGKVWEQTGTNYVSPYAKLNGRPMFLEVSVGNPILPIICGGDWLAESGDFAAMAGIALVIPGLEELAPFLGAASGFVWFWGSRFC